MLRNASAWFFACCVAVAGCSGTQTQSEVVKATTPYDDGKPNSSAVPDGYRITTAFERIVVLRFKFDVDLLDGIERQVKELGIEDAVILVGIGSVRGYHVHSVSNRSRSLERSTAHASRGSSGSVVQAIDQEDQSIEE